MINPSKLINALALLLFVVAMLITPWPEIFEGLYGYPYIDRENYRDYFLYQRNIIDYKDFSSPFSYFTNEYLWHYIVGFFGQSCDIEVVFGIVSAFCLFVFAAVAIKEGGLIALPLLLNPLVVDFAFSQLRLALAISLLGVAFLIKKKSKLTSLAVAFASLFVHSAAIIFLLIYLAVVVINGLESRWGLPLWAKFMLLVAVGTLISLMLGPLREALLSMIGDRRVDYPDMSSSFKYSLFYIIMLAAMAADGRAFLKNECHQFSIIVLSIVAINVIHGGYSTRFLAASYPFLVSSVLAFRGVLVIIFAAFLMYQSLQWAYWLRIF